MREYNEARPHQGRWCFGKTQGIDLETVQIDDPRHFFDVMVANSFA
jgi:hypothetical protein